MLSVLREVFSMWGSADFVTRDCCGRWAPGFVQLSQFADATLFAVYGAIAVAILILWRTTSVYGVFQEMKGRTFGLFPISFALVFGMCAVLHLAEALAFTWPAYNLFAVIKATTAIVSIPTPFIFLWFHWVLISRIQKAHSQYRARAETSEAECYRLQQLLDYNDSCPE